MLRQKYENGRDTAIGSNGFPKNATQGSTSGSIPFSPLIKSERNGNFNWEGRAGLLRSKPSMLEESSGIRGNFSEHKYHKALTPSNDFASYLRSKSFDETHKYSLSSGYYKSFGGVHHTHSKSYSDSSRQGATSAETVRQSKRLDFNIPRARISNFLFEHGSSIKETRQKALGGISRFKTKTASTGEQKGTTLEEISSAKNTPRKETNVHLAELHKSVQHLDIIEHDAALEQDMSVCFIGEDQKTQDSLTFRISQLASNTNKSSNLKLAIQEELSKEESPLQAAAQCLADYATLVASLKDKLSKKEQIENIYLGEINKLQSELSKTSQRQSEKKFTFSASKLAERSKNLVISRASSKVNKAL